MDETERNIERLKQARDFIAVGKLSGAVGTYSNIDPFIEEYVCEKLGIKAARLATQVIQRDRHADFLTTLAIIGSSLDKMATEIRNLLQPFDIALCLIHPQRKLQPEGHRFGMDAMSTTDNNRMLVFSGTAFQDSMEFFQMTQ